MSESANAQDEQLAELNRLREQVARLEAMCEREADHDAALHVGQVGLWEWDLITNDLHIDTNFKGILGYAEDEISDPFTDWNRLVYQADADEIMRQAWSYLEGISSEYEIVHRMVHKNGSIRWILMRGAVLSDADGARHRMVGTGTDITAQRQAEQALRDSEARHRALVDAIPDIMLRIRRDGILVDAKFLPGASGPMVRADPSIIGQDLSVTLTGLVSDEVFSAGMRTIEEAIHTGEMQVYDFHIDRDDQRRYYEARMVGSGRDECIAIIRNTTEQRRALAALSQSEEKYRLLFERLNDTVLLVDVETGIILDANEQAEVLLDRPRHEIIGMHQTKIHPPDQEARYWQIFTASHSTGDRAEFDVDVIKKSGEIVPAAIRTVPVMVGERQCLIGIIRDVSVRREAEKQQLQLTLEKERVKILASFVSDVSHEVRTPLSVVHLNLEALERTAELDDRSRQRIKELKSQTLYISDLVEAMLLMSQLDNHTAYHFAPTDLNLLVREVTGGIGTYSQEKDLQIELSLANDLPPVYADNSTLSKAVSRLLDNAIDFTPEGGLITVQTTVDGREALIAIRDTGIGISPEDIQRIFERFYRANRARTGRKAGLGLSIAKKIIDVHQGVITVDSIPGHGSTFTIRLPLTDG